MNNLVMSSNASAANAGWAIASVILAIVGGIVLYFTFLKKSNDGKYTGFWGWVYDFLSFKKMMVEDILRICYLIFALFITLGSFSLIGTNFLEFVLTLILGNIFVRMIFELTLVLLVICRNTTGINDKMGKFLKAPEAVKKAEPKPAPKADEPKAE